MALNEGGTFRGTLFGVLQAAFPLQHCPAWKVVLSHLGEDPWEVHLSIPKRAETTCTVDPGLVTAINSLSTSRVEFCILDMEDLDHVVIDVDVLQIVQGLQDIVTGIIKHSTAWVIARSFQQHFEGHSVMKIFAWMNFVANINSGILKGIEDWGPTLGQLVKGCLDKSCRSLWPWIHVGPRQCS